MEEKNWKKAEIIKKIDHNSTLIKQRTFFFLLLLAYGIATPIAVKIANLSPAEVAFYEQFVIMGTGVISPIFAIKLHKLHKENLRLEEELLDLEEDEIEEEQQEESKEMKL